MSIKKIEGLILLVCLVFIFPACSLITKMSMRDDVLQEVKTGAVRTSGVEAQEEVILSISSYEWKMDRDKFGIEVAAKKNKLCYLEEEVEKEKTRKSSSKFFKRWGQWINPILGIAAIPYANQTKYQNGNCSDNRGDACVVETKPNQKVFLPLGGILIGDSLLTWAFALSEEGEGKKEKTWQTANRLALCGSEQFKEARIDLKIKGYPKTVSGVTNENGKTFLGLKDIPWQVSMEKEIWFSLSAENKGKEIQTEFLLSGANLSEFKQIASTLNPPKPPKLIIQNVKIEDRNKDGIVEGKENFQIKFDLVNDGVGFARDVQVRLSGDEQLINLLLTERNTVKEIPPGETEKITFSSQDWKSIPFNLKNGVSNLVLTARDSLGISEAEKKVEVKTRPFIDPEVLPDTPAKPNPRLAAVVVGIGKYEMENIPSIPYAVKDAQAVGTYLEKVVGVPRENIKLLINEKAGSGGIKGALGKLHTENFKNIDRVYFYYSGHGSSIKDKTGEAKSYILPYNGDYEVPEDTMLSLAEIQKRLESLPAKEVIVMLDSCFSGMGARAGKKDRAIIVVSDSAIGSNKVISFSASKFNETSADFERAGYGLFTYFLLRGLRGEADINGDKNITLREWSKYVRENVEKVSSNELNGVQHPQVSPIKFDLEGEEKDVLIRRMQ